MRRIVFLAVVLLGSAIVAAGVPQSSPPAGAPAGRGRGGRGIQPGLEPRIVVFEARPAEVRAGEPMLLVWQTANPVGSVTIDPEVGAVTPRGSKQIIPSATTTFTLSAGGGVSRTVTVTVRGAAASGASNPTLQRTRPSRMPDGKPDLTGVYNFAGLPAGTTAPPLKPDAEKFRIVRGDREIRGRTTLTTGNDCKPLGIPQSYDAVSVSERADAETSADDFRVPERHPMDSARWSPARTRS